MTRGIVAALLAMALACAAARNRTASTRVRPKRSASTLVRQDAPADRSLPHDGNLWPQVNVQPLARIESRSYGTTSASLGGATGIGAVQRTNGEHALMNIFHSKLDPNEIEVIGARHTPLSDLYHQLLRAPWWLDLLGVSGVFLLINLLFALAYVAVGGVAGARLGSLADHFFFSVQTMGTIGYGVMYPLSSAAEVLVTGEVIVGVSLVALTTGILFAKFQRATRANAVRRVCDDLTLQRHSHLDVSPRQ